MEEVAKKIRLAEENLKIAETEGDIARRDRLEMYLIELQRKENLLLEQQAPPAPAPGNYPVSENFI